jgi:probable HAF family extracellular repeat protein
VIVGYFDALRGGNRAFRYTPATGMQDLGALGQGERSYALDVNDAGVIVGYSHVSPGAQHAFRYTDATGMVDLGILPDGVSSRALAVNNAGVVVGTAYRSILSTDTVAALWKPDGTLVDLDLWFDQVNPAEGEKWTLRSANAVNERGLVVGSGLYYDGDGGLTDGYVAFMLDASSLVPEPGGATLALLLSAWTVTRRRRCVN